MTKEQNNLRQKIWQKKRKIKIFLAWRWIMAEIQGSEKGMRIIKTGLRKVLRGADSTPAQRLRAAELLYAIERGVVRTVIEKVEPEKIVSSLPPVDITPTPDETDPEMAELLKRVRG